MMHASPESALAASARAQFQREFGSAPALAAWAPGRVNLIGDHVDYCGGLVLPMAIDMGTVVCASQRDDGRVRAVSRERISEPLNFALVSSPADLPTAFPPWGRYVAGVLAKLREAGVPVSGLNLAIAGDLPTGAGLSSSASLEVATALAALAVAKRDMDTGDIARLCREAEHKYAGVPCGIMDQYTVAHAREGSAILIDCHELSHRFIPIDPAVSIIIAHSGTSHDLADGAYADRRQTCERAFAKLIAVIGPRPTLRHVLPTELESARASLSEVEYRRARHVISECRRTLQAAAAVEQGDHAAFGRLMVESHDSLRDDFEVSRPEVDAHVARANALPGVFGSRMTGGGFGGCIVALVESDAAAGVVRSLSSLLPAGTLCRIVRPSAGACIL